MSTEDLPPNLLPEDYLDEVISQYFNNDSSSEDQANCDTAAKTRRASLKEMLSENSTNEDEDETEEEIVPDDIPQLDDKMRSSTEESKVLSGRCISQLLKVTLC